MSIVSFSHASRVLFASALGLAAASCQVSTSGLLNRAKSPGGASGGGSSGGGSSGDSSSSSSSDSSSGGGSSDASGGSGAEEATVEDYEVPYFAPAPGVAAVGPFKAPWCTKAEPRDNWGPGAMARTITGQYALDTAKTMAPLLCLTPDDSRFQKMVGAYIQLFVNETGATPTQVTDFLTLFRKEDHYQGLNEETCKKFKLDDEASERTKAIARMSGRVVGCDSYGQVSNPMWISSQGDLDPSLHGLWHLDREAALPSQLTGIYHVLSCVASGGPDDTWGLVRYARCRADVQQLDEKKLTAELKADGLNEQARAVAVLAMAKAKYRASLFEKALQAKAAADPELKALLIDAPEKAWNAWVAARKANKAAVDAARAYEDLYTGPRRSAAKGCLKEAHGNLEAYADGHSGKTRDELIDAVADPIGIILFEHARSCNEMEGRAEVEAMLEQFIRWGKPARGPRFAAQVAMASLVASIVSDRPKFAVTPDMMSVGDLSAPVPLGYGRHDQVTVEKGGIVAKVERKGDRVYVTFKTDKWTENEENCHSGSRIVMFEPDGTPIYEWLCKRTGRKVTRSSTSEPFYTSPEMARGIAAGTFVRYRTGVERDSANIFSGTPAEVWKNQEMKDLVAIYGVLAK